MPEYLYHIFAIAGFTFGILGTRYDYTASTQFKWTGQGEGIKWFKDKYGHFAAGRFLTLAIIIHGGLIAVYLVTISTPGYALFAAVMSVFAGAHGWVHGHDNRNHANEDRREQRAALESMFSGWETKIVNQRQGDRWCFKLFQWIYEDFPEDTKLTDAEHNALRERLLVRLKRAAEADPKTWFSESWYREEY